MFGLSAELIRYLGVTRLLESECTTDPMHGVLCSEISTEGTLPVSLDLPMPKRYFGHPL